MGHPTAPPAWPAGPSVLTLVLLIFSRSPQPRCCCTATAREDRPRSAPTRRFPEGRRLGGGRLRGRAPGTRWDRGYSAPSRECGRYSEPHSTQDAVIIGRGQQRPSRLRGKSARSGACRAAAGHLGVVTRSDPIPPMTSPGHVGLGLGMAAGRGQDPAEQSPATEDTSTGWSWCTRRRTPARNSSWAGRSWRGGGRGSGTGTATPDQAR